METCILRSSVFIRLMVGGEMLLFCDWPLGSVQVRDDR